MCCARGLASPGADTEAELADAIHALGIYGARGAVDLLAGSPLNSSCWR